MQQVLKKMPAWPNMAAGIGVLLLLTAWSVDSSYIYIYNLGLFLLFFSAGAAMAEDESLSRYAAKSFSSRMAPYFYGCAVFMAVDIAKALASADTSTIENVTGIMYSNLVKDFFLYSPWSGFDLQWSLFWILPALFFAQTLVYGISRLPYGRYLQLPLCAAAAFLPVIFPVLAGLPFSIAPALFLAPLCAAGYLMRSAGKFPEDSIAGVFALLLTFVPALLLWIGKTFLSASAVFGFSAVSVLVIALCAAVILLLCRLYAFAADHLDETAALPLVYLEKGLGFLGEKSAVLITAGQCGVDTGLYSRLAGFLHLPEGLHTFLFAVLDALCAVLLRLYDFAHNWITEKLSGFTSKRDASIDIEKGILIVSVLLGHYTAWMNWDLRTVIFSYHMPAFVLLSGYFYRRKGFWKTCGSILRTYVIPYIACCIAHYCLFGGESPDMNALMKQYLFGMFQTSAVFTDVGGVGYIYFVPMILATRLIYTLVDWITFKIEILKAAAVFALTACGIWLSSQGLWLPWSFDVSLYCLIFYWAGEQLHQYKVLQYLAARPYYYFILALIWVYGISTGQLEIAVRSYAPYLEVIAGAVAGTLAVYLASVHIARYWPIAATWLLKELGQATIYILIIHTLFKNPLIEYLGQWYDPAQMDNLFRAVPIQLGAGLAIWLAVKLLRTVFKCITRPLRKEKRKEKESVELRLQNRFE